jgi:hypothetical protein
MAGVREVTGRVIAFDRSRGRGIVEIEGRAVVVDAAVVDASHLVSGDAVVVELVAPDRVTAVRVTTAAKEAVAPTTRGLFTALLDSQAGAPREIVEALVDRPDLASCVRAWLDRWDRPIRFWEPNNVAIVVDRRRGDPELTEVFEGALATEGPPERNDWPPERNEWIEARLRER